jgi:spore germination cell wall hydrolase CwlJ-like protein
MISAITCMAVAIYFEARNQPVAGQLAVAHVISNRVASKHYPDTVCEVIQQGAVYKSGHPVKHRCQFSFWCDSKPETIHDYGAWQTAMRVAATVRDTSYPRVDVSEGATHYHTTEVSPKWRYTMKMTVQIGQHLFYKP